MQTSAQCTRYAERCCTWLVTIQVAVVRTTSLAIYKVVQRALGLVVPKPLPSLLPPNILPVLPVELASGEQRDEPERTSASNSLDSLKAFSADRPESFFCASQHVVHEPLSGGVHKGLLHPTKTDEENPSCSVHEAC